MPNVEVATEGAFVGADFVAGLALDFAGDLFGEGLFAVFILAVAGPIGGAVLQGSSFKTQGHYLTDPTFSHGTC